MLLRWPVASFLNGQPVSSVPGWPRGSHQGSHSVPPGKTLTWNLQNGTFGRLASFGFHVNLAGKIQSKDHERYDTMTPTSTAIPSSPTHPFQLPRRRPCWSLLDGPGVDPHRHARAAHARKGAPALLTCAHPRDETDAWTFKRSGGASLGKSGSCSAKGEELGRVLGLEREVDSFGVANLQCSGNSANCTG